MSAEHLGRGKKRSRVISLVLWAVKLLPPKINHKLGLHNVFEDKLI